LVEKFPTVLEKLPQVLRGGIILKLTLYSSPVAADEIASASSAILLLFF